MLSTVPKSFVKMVISIVVPYKFVCRFLLLHPFSSKFFNIPKDHFFKLAEIARKKFHTFL